MTSWDGIVAVDLDGRGCVEVLWMLKEICSEYNEEKPKI